MPLFMDIHSFGHGVAADEIYRVQEGMGPATRARPSDKEERK